jgi:hypothetical protein
MANINLATGKSPLVPQGWGIWAEINYLDSPTEYREYLPNAPVQNPGMSADFILLSASEHSSKVRRWIFLVGTCLVGALVVGYSVYALMDIF